MHDKAPPPTFNPLDPLPGLGFRWKRRSECNWHTPPPPPPFLSYPAAAATTEEDCNCILNYPLWLTRPNLLAAGAKFTVAALCYNVGTEIQRHSFPHTVSVPCHWSQIELGPTYGRYRRLSRPTGGTLMEVLVLYRTRCLPVNRTPGFRSPSFLQRQTFFPYQKPLERTKSGLYNNSCEGKLVLSCSWEQQQQ